MEQVLSLFKALSDRNRMRIVLSLMEHEELCACQITEMLGVAGPTVSRHLAQLQAAGLITSRKDGRWNFFKLNDEQPSEFPLEWLEHSLTDSQQAMDDRVAMASILLEKPEEICRRQRG